MAEPPAPAISRDGGDRARLLDHREHRRRAGERLRAELLDQAADLERDHRAERDRDQGGRDDRHRGDEPGLLDELAQLERALEQVARHVEPERESLPAVPIGASDPRGGAAEAISRQAPGAMDMFVLERAREAA